MRSSHRRNPLCSFADSVAHSVQIWRHVRALGRVDAIHSFGRLAYLVPLLRSRVPKIQSYQRHVSRRSVRLGQALARGGTLSFAACSQFCAGTASVSGARWVVVPNGAPAAAYAFRAAVGADAPLVFLGRVERVKGVHTAIRVARMTGRRLLIAGNAARGGQYFDREIAPHVDGSDIAYLGPVTDAQKDALLGRAAALLFPVEWDEPFGIVMAEALACGTPVVAFRRGAVPEVVEHGVTGFVCDTADEMAEAVRRLPELSRARCRASYEERFSDRVVVDGYERLYRAVAGVAGPRLAWR